jgi:hypothetical protein
MVSSLTLTNHRPERGKNTKIMNYIDVYNLPNGTKIIGYYGNIWLKIDNFLECLETTSFTEKGKYHSIMSFRKFSFELAP